MKTFLFEKYSGAGNDFILFDVSKNKELHLTRDFIRQICKPHTGIGADGVLVINGATKADFQIKYFNSDGSTGSLCGNGARCVIKYAVENKIVKNTKNIKFLFCEKYYTGAIINNNEVRFDFKIPSEFKFEKKIIKTKNQLINAYYAYTGAPHLVIKIEDVFESPKNSNAKFNDITKFPVVKLGEKIRYSPEFLPNGTNVNFVQIKNNNVYIRTYERGVENETLACGTGSVAAALILRVTDKLVSPISLITKIGEKLKVEFTVEKHKFKSVSLTGPAKKIFTGKITI